MKAAIKAGAKVDGQGMLGFAPLHMAVANDDKKACDLLIEAGADLDVKTKNGMNPADLAASEKNWNALPWS